MSTNLKFIKQEINWIDIALKSNKPFLGVCLGAQMLVKNFRRRSKKKY